MNAQIKSKKAVIYCRVSTKEQVEEGNSLITQEKNCREYASKYGYEIVDVFIEQGESAKTADRTELKKLLSFCAIKKNNVGIVIAYKIDRISRNTDDYSQIRILLKRYGVEIKSTSEHFEDSPAGRFMENIIANVAQFDNDVRAERSIGGMRQALQEGRYVWMAPLGYSNVKVNGKSTIAPNQVGEGLKKAFELIASQQLTVNDTRLFVVTLGVSQKNGKPLSKSHFYNILKNKLYIGEMHKFNKVYQGMFETLISPTVFNAVQSIISRKKISKNYTIENPDFPLRRFVFNENNVALTGCWSKGRMKKYPYYRFNGSPKFYKKDEMENKFVELLNTFQLKKEYINQFQDIVLSILKNKTNIYSKMKSEIKIHQQNLLIKKQIIIEKSINGILPDIIVKEELEKITEELAQLEIKLNEEIDGNINTELIFQKIELMLINPGEYWRSQSFEVQRKLMWFDFPSGLQFDGENYRTTKVCSIFKLKDLLEPMLSFDVHHPDYKSKPSQMAILNKDKLLYLFHQIDNEILAMNE